MDTLDNLKIISKLDSQNMLGSIERLGKQAQEIKAQGAKFVLPSSYKKVKKIIVAGMGGSALGAQVVKAVFAKELKVSLEVINDYHLPAYTNKETLVICSSYSGSTEEILNVAAEAKKIGAKVVVICAGGKLGAWTKNHKIPALIFTTKNNPCGSPRMGLGYSVFGQLLILSKAGLIKLPEVKQSVAVINKHIKAFGPLVKNNPAKQIAREIFGRSVWYVASEHLSGNAHAAANQMNENAKRFAGFFLIPELNHHLMEGMMHPSSNKKDLAVVMLASKLYDARVQKRQVVTAEILRRNKIEFTSYLAKEKTKLAQACEVLVLGAYVSFYSAMLEGIDPTAIPFVDYFKKQLSKPRHWRGKGR